MNDTDQPNFQDQLAATPSDLAGDDVETESKKRSLMTNAAVGTLILAAVGGLYFMYAKSGPATASAATEAQAVKSMLDDSAKSASAMRQQQKELEKTVAQFKNFPAAAQVSLDQLHRDPFTEATAPKTAKVDDTGRARELQKADAMKRVQTLRVQSVMLGDQSRSCMINDKLRVEGEAFDGFEIERVSADGVIVRHAGFRFLLQVQR